MPELLSVFGHQPVRIEKQGNEYWYISPFRYEKEPSFHTSYLGGKWLWNDFGRGDVQGSGTVIGFLELHENVNVSEALGILKALFPHRGHAIDTQSLSKMPLFKGVSLSSPKKQAPLSADKLVVREVNEQVRHKGLIGYLAGERKINHKLALPYLKQITYENRATGKIYHTLGFENDSGDFECRDKFFKGILKNPIAKDRNAAKDITYIPGKDQSRVAVFEGFMDFLTAITIKGKPVLAIDVIVLNMVNMKGRALDFIRQHGYEKVYTFFDNDEAGDKAIEFFTYCFGTKIFSQNMIYEPLKDLNNYLQLKCK